MNTFNAPAGIVYVVDDDEAVRESIQWLLESLSYTVRPFDSAETFLEQFDDSQVSCLLLDVRMPGMSGLELQQKMLKELPYVPPLAFITGHGDVPMAVESMKHGAFDFLQKPFDNRRLLMVVDRMLVKSSKDQEMRKRKSERDSLLERLTNREEQVLRLIVDGRLNKQIADELSISIKTVEAHRANIMEKIGVNTVAELMRVVLHPVE
jgi:FixJ family two-component response regulator